MSPNAIPLRKSSINAKAASRARARRSGAVARMVPLPGSAMPSASHKQFMEFAVNIPLQLPHVGHAADSSSASRASSIVPATRAPTPSNTEMRSTVRPLRSMPACIGPPERKIVGRFTRAAPMSIPGTILSQFGMQIMASKQCARAIVSTASAMSSREGNEYRIPSCPMMMPSSTPIVLNSNGTPPASRTASFTTRPNSWRCTCPGTMSTYELQTATNGLSKSLGVRIWPVARSRLRWGARSSPRLMVSERITANCARRTSDRCS